MKMHLTAAALAGLATATAAPAAVLVYTVDLDPLNGSNVEGNGVLTLDTDTLILDVELNVRGVEPDLNPNDGTVKSHFQHIHGLVDPVADSVFPPAAADTDGDGFIEVAEGAAFYGPVLVPLANGSVFGPGTSLAGDGFPVTETGNYVYTQTIDLNDSSVFAGGFGVDELFPLFFREIVIHGKTVATGEGAGTPGEVDGTGGYIPILPVAAGEIVGPPIPEPGSIALLGAAGLLGLRRRR